MNIVIGGGIGGLTLAVAMQQRGLAVEVYEAVEAFEAVGAGIALSSNAMQVLDWLGGAEAVVEAGAEIETAEVVKVSGQRIQRAEMAEFRRTFGWGTVAIHRADLHGILWEKLADGTVRFGKVCRRVEQSDGSVRVGFDDGSEVAGECVVGADGIQSRVRGEVFGMVQLRYSGQTCWRGVVPFEWERHQKARLREIWGGDVRFGYTAIGEGKYYWFAPVVEPNPDDCELGKSELVEMYDEFPEPVGQLLEATEAGSIIRTDLYDVEPMASWSSGRVVLLGDAAHAPTPNLGQGAAQAIEDGWALAASLDRAEGPEPAFRRYEKARLQRANGITQQSRRFGQLAHLDSPLVGGALHAALGAIPEPLNRWGMRRLLDVSYLEGLG